ncbi:MAG: hypothetical protein ACI85K_001794 [Hyphomicrobiaceae bacterium]|jgi:hypothetical protein
MSSSFRNVLILLIASFLAIPTLCDEGGGTGGGGVWILPCCANLGGVTPVDGAQPRSTKSVTNTTLDVTMRTAGQMGAASATFVDDMLGIPVSLTVSGRLVTLPKTLLQALESSVMKTATIVITDAVQSGYVMRVTILPGGSVKIAIY